MAHGVKPLFPFDLAQATFLVPPPESDSLDTTALITFRARQLQKRREDIDAIREKVLKSRFQSIKQFEQTFKNHIKDYNFAPGSLVLVRNTRVEKELNRKTKPRYLGPMLVVRRTKGGSYMLAELDGSISKLRYAAFRLLPYHARSRISVPVTSIVGFSDEALESMEGIEEEELEGEEPDEDEYE
ncbi:hypothetical protein PAXINDRAFT_91864 [Paxillus involutus ATCC 200175]|uniref:Uncharacterized protein n=2 Tax=Paxillus involutus ATCC 200175 TaxID=664439 RepID=A0A0C9SMP4_PAXIN|nr:hypothetical protein PAXINDRAFT_91864 [Paxillus involutus ATCC 200175]